MKINKILIGIDDSTYARNAAAYGFEMARNNAAAVSLVHIIEPVVFQQDPTDSLSGMPIDSVMGMAQAEIPKIQTELSSAIIENIIKEFGGDLEVTKFIEYDSTAGGIINCAQQFGADLIVVGTHKRSGFDRLIMGSIAEEVVRHSTVPVLVVPLVE